MRHLLGHFENSIFIGKMISHTTCLDHQGKISVLNFGPSSPTALPLPCLFPISSLPPLSFPSFVPSSLPHSLSFFPPRHFGALSAREKAFPRAKTASTAALPPSPSLDTLALSTARCSPGDDTVAPDPRSLSVRGTNRHSFFDRAA